MDEFHLNQNVKAVLVKSSIHVHFYEQMIAMRKKAREYFKRVILKTYSEPA